MAFVLPWSRSKHGINDFRFVLKVWTLLWNAINFLECDHDGRDDCSNDPTLPSFNTLRWERMIWCDADLCAENGNRNTFRLLSLWAVPKNSPNGSKDIVAICGSWHGFSISSCYDWWYSNMEHLIGHNTFLLLASFSSRTLLCTMDYFLSSFVVKRAFFAYPLD